VGPVLGLVPFDFQQYSTVAEHYLYPAMAGVAMAAAVLVLAAMNLVGASGAAVRRGGVVVRRAPAWVAAGLLVVLAVRSNVQARTWADNLSLFAHAVEVNPDSRPGRSSLALTLMDRGRPDEALPHAQRAVELDPKNAGYWVVLSNAYRQLGLLAPAIEAGERALAAAPDDPIVITHVGSLYAQRSGAQAERNNAAAAQRDAEVARVRLEQAVAVGPKVANARLNLGTFYFQAGRVEDALRELKAAVELAPGSPLARANYGYVLVTRGDLAAAREQFTEALRYQPNLQLAIDGLEEIRRRQGGR
jgi:protein O-mannosyl-transferase